MIEQIIQLAGALLILAGFAGSQLGWFDARSLQSLVLNAVGSGTLAIIAILGREWGFILLESSWALISLAGLIRLLSQHRAVAR